MNISIQMGECTLEQLEKVIGWLKTSPMDLNPASIDAIAQTANARVTIRAPRITEKKS